MKPYVTCHMVASIDGRTLIGRWRPEDAERRRFFEALHDRLGVDSWLIGGVSGRGYAERDAYPNHTNDAHLARLREDGVSYILAGARELELDLALEVLNHELGVKRLEVNGGRVTNGAFLRAGLIDEISLAIFPAVDGTKGSSNSFDSSEDRRGSPAAIDDACKQRGAGMRSGLAALSGSERLSSAG
jgi:riboflavin biosynthesis pyrimidine reductase